MNMKKILAFATVIAFGGITGGCGNVNENEDKEKDENVVQNVKAVVLEDNCSAAILDNGDLYTWGDNENGQLGNGQKGESSGPKKILDNAVSIQWGTDSGHEFGAALTDDGSLYTWGNNERGQLGTGDDKNSLTPVKVMDNIRDFSIGSCCMGAITNDGDLYTWGENYNGFLEVSGQIGNGTEEDALKPVKILENVRTVDFGAYHAGAIKEDGSLYTWGSNHDGELGNGEYADSLTPIKIMDNVVEIDFTGFVSMALTEKGELYTWGTNDDGKLGIGVSELEIICSREPMMIMSNVKTVNSGSAITNDNELYLWSSEVADEIMGESLSPVKVMDDVSFGNDSYAITNDGILYLWGENYYGQLGNGNSGGKDNEYNEGIDSWIPVKVMDNVASVSLGRNHSAAITKDGILYIWGNNSSGQLGNGTSENSDTPIKAKFPAE